jgi:glutamate racemase
MSLKATPRSLMSENAKPIGVFDSGIGGLTVLKEILNELPLESTAYLGDTARVPYGIRSPETVTRYSFENTRFLSSRGIKMLVVACNTVSAVSLEAIKKSVSIPVIGVIDPGAKAAVNATKNKRVGVIGTSATIRSNSYTKAIRAADSSVEVFPLPCPLFVPLVEEGWTDGPIVEMTAERYLREVREKGIDTLVLGCTHYPLLKNVLSKIMGPGVTLIDSAIETAAEIKETLGRLSLLKPASGDAAREFYVTDSPDKFIEIGERFIGRKIEFIRKIELGPEV